jgi:hypothetical protein
MKTALQLFALLAVACGARDGFLGSKVGTAACSAGGNYNDCVLADKPVGYWPLDDTAIDAVRDISGNELHGTMTTGVAPLQLGLLNAPFKVAMAFNGGGVLLPTVGGLVFTADASFSIEMWLQTTNLATQLPFSQQRCTPDSVQLWLEGGSAGFRVATDSAVDIRTLGSTLLADGLPHYVVGMRDIEAGVIRIYVDGTLDNETTDTNRTTGSLVNYPTDTWLGRRSDCGGENPFFGILDEVAIYPKVLSPERIAQRYALGISALQPTAP